MGEGKSRTCGSNTSYAKLLTTSESSRHALLPTPRPGYPDQGLIQRINDCGNKVQYAKGSTLFAQGESSRAVFLLLEGSVKLYVESPDGKTLVLALLGPGALLGAAAAIVRRNHQTSAEASAPATVVLLSRDSFLRLVQENTRSGFEAARLLSQESFDLLDQVKAVGLSESAPQKLAAFLLRMRRANAQDDGTCIRLTGMTQSDFAQMVGLSRETANRLLSRLRRRRVLNWKRSTLFIQDWNVLENLALAPEIADRDKSDRT